MTSCKPTNGSCNSVAAIGISTGTSITTGIVSCTGRSKFRVTVSGVPAGKVTLALELILTEPVVMTTRALGISAASASVMRVVVWTGTVMLRGTSALTGITVLMVALSIFSKFEYRPPMMPDPIPPAVDCNTPKNGQTPNRIAIKTTLTIKERQPVIVQNGGPKTQVLLGAAALGDG